MAKEKVEKKTESKSEKRRKEVMKKGEFVSAKEFSDFRKNIFDILEEITNKLPNLKNGFDDESKPDPLAKIGKEDIRKNMHNVEKKPDVPQNQVESPVPPAFREIVQELLGDEFGIRVFDFRDRTDFQVDIIVPEKYTSTPVAERFPNFVDVRSKIINRALGETGVREWVMKIRMNLNKYFTNQGLASPFKS